MSEIYNKNAREKALLEEAYTGIYNEEAVDVELDHWWDFDEQDVVLKVYHGALRQLPPAAGTPEYEANSEKIFTWLKGKYPQPDEYHPGYGKVEDAEMEFDERGFAKNTEAGREGENGDFGNRNLKDELEEIQNLVDDFLGMHFEAGDHDDIAKAIHHVKTLLSDITDDGKYSREPSNIGLPGAQY